VYFTSAAAGPLPPHHAAIRPELDAEVQKARTRVAGQRRARGEPKNFQINDAVLLKPPSGGRVGHTIDRCKLPLLVVGTRKCGAKTQFQVWCKHGVLEEWYDSGRLAKATTAEAAQLKSAFAGVVLEKQPTISTTAARNRHSVRCGQAAPNSQAPGCACRRSCGKACPCKKAGILCSRNDCRCKACKGWNCGNFNHKP